ncbi:MULTISPECIES: alpha/beta fold hydrolase [Bradyrhizobium]|uniref:alpha/beta fold hydrolase n=1 Tax=Bradyrhizobium TaxID=374 RepID=UPI000231C2C8|nr:alpha/beta fold hydrolase [Bradyrhizobium japonicum]AJA60617.1 alpha/beta hydrolase [Bradyrhizobium japonicum]KMJ99896.1 alpha/beta hydrolase [Bradyrhizobium japonicum]MBR0765687.1 alpha/beta fold hydrolase [Bradyrhizobium japonicum]MCS3496731.1 pimeloyl-ACP methyl ester carboxylesterase [Bradyrhizobium japonicum]MCS3534485.1 pimeloyl-ACP methyl ester carboxylesterase [Bradyrhizobium japonicum]
MDQTTPLLLVPGLASSARIYAPVVPALWRFGPVMIANHSRDDSMAAIARRVLSEAPSRFALAGHSMGGYIALEIMRQAPERVLKLALINTQARPDTPEATARRRGLMERARRGELSVAREEMFPELVHPSRRDDAGIRKLVHEQGEDVGVEGYLRQQTAIIARVDSRPTLATIKCPTLVLTGDQDNTIPNAFSREMAEGIAGARLVILERCGHLPQPEQPEATARALAEWLGAPVVSGPRTA